MVLTWRRWLLLAFLLAVPLRLEAQPFPIPAVVTASLSSSSCPGTGCVQMAVRGYAGGGVQVGGSFTGTLTFEGAIGTDCASATYKPVNFTPADSTTPQSTTTAAGLFQGPIAGLSCLQVRFSAYTSGTATVGLLAAFGGSASRTTGGGSPAGPSTSVQFNDGGSFNGVAAFEIDKVNSTLTATSDGVNHPTDWKLGASVRAHVNENGEFSNFGFTGNATDATFGRNNGVNMTGAGGNNTFFGTNVASTANATSSGGLTLVGQSADVTSASGTLATAVGYSMKVPTSSAGFGFNGTGDRAQQFLISLNNGNGSLGPQVVAAASSDSVDDRRNWSITGVWATATDATRKGRALFQAWDATTAREFMRGETNGTNAMIGFLGATASLAQTGDLASALTTFGLMTGSPTLADTKVSFTDNVTGNAATTQHGYQAKGTGSTSTFYRSDNTQAAVTDANLSVSDVTTNNVTSTAHGFAPKSPANAAQFLNGAATPAYASVTDANLSTSDITTNDCTAAKHGFAPKGDGNVNHFLNGSCAYSAATATVAITETEINFDTCGVSVGTIHASFTCTATVTDAGVSGTSKIIVLQSGAAPTGRQADENDMDPLACNALAGAGSFTVICKALNGPAHGKYKLNYLVG